MVEQGFKGKGALSFSHLFIKHISNHKEKRERFDDLMKQPPKKPANCNSTPAEGALACTDARPDFAEL